MRLPLSALAEGTKWPACSAVAESGAGRAPRNSGSFPAVKMNSSEILVAEPLGGQRGGGQGERYETPIRSAASILQTADE